MGFKTLRSFTVRVMLVADLMKSKIFNKKTSVKRHFISEGTAVNSTCIAVTSYFWRCNVNSTHNLLRPHEIKTVVLN